MMIKRLAVDANFAIEVIRANDAPAPEPLQHAENIVLPLPALGELLTGIYSSSRAAENFRILENLIETWTVLQPDMATAHAYGRLRASLRDMPRTTQSRINDLWIAALCIQHSLPLLTKDGGFDTIPDLTVIHW